LKVFPYILCVPSLFLPCFRPLLKPAAVFLYEVKTAVQVVFDEITQIIRNRRIVEIGGFFQITFNLGGNQLLYFFGAFAHRSLIVVLVRHVPSGWLRGLIAVDVGPQFLERQCPTRVLRQGARQLGAGAAFVVRQLDQITH